MKKILFLASLMAMLAVTVNAQTPVRNNPQAGPQNKMYNPQQVTDFAFEGILLDINQQTRIDSLNAAERAKAAQRMGKPGKDGKECHGKAECKKGDCDKAKCDRPKCDKAKCDKAKCDKAECKKDCKKDCINAECKAADCKDCKCDKAECGKAKAECPKGQTTECAKAKGTECKREQPSCPKARQACNGDSTCAVQKAPRGPQMQHQGRMPFSPEYMIKVKEILTPEQFVVFQQNIQKMPKSMLGAPNGHRGEGPQARPAKKGDKVIKDGGKKGEKKLTKEAN